VEMESRLESLRIYRRLNERTRNPLLVGQIRLRMETFGILVWHLGRKTLGRTEFANKAFIASSGSLYAVSVYCLSRI
jgi:hypothetical protein